jgi:hypothetical protein
MPQAPIRISLVAEVTQARRGSRLGFEQFQRSVPNN